MAIDVENDEDALNYFLKNFLSESFSNDLEK
jgi:hypothetical protein